MPRVAIPLAVVLAATTAVHAQDGSAVSTERISEALKRPALEIPPIQLPDTPTFKVTVEGEWVIETPLQTIRRELAEEAGSTHRIVPGAGMTPPLVAVDVFPAIAGAITYIRDMRYAHAVEDARRRVAEDLAAFCAEHDCTPTESPPSEGVILTPLQPK